MMCPATLWPAKAVPYIVNFQMVDTDKDGGRVRDWQRKGWVQNADASTTKEMTPAAKL
jgi:hypothetical protein